MTASNSQSLTAAQSLDLLGRLQKALARLASAESKSLGELQRQEQQLQRRQRDAGHRALANAQARQEQDEEAWAHWQAHFANAQEKRRALIQEAYARSTRDLEVRGQRKRDQYLGDLQMRHFQAERKKPRELKQLEADHLSRQAELAEERKELVELAQRISRALQGTRATRRLFEQVSPNEDAHLQPLPEQIRDLTGQVESLEGIALLKLARLAPPTILVMAILLLVPAVLVWTGALHRVGYWLGGAAGLLLLLGVAALVYAVRRQVHGPAAALAQAMADTQAKVEHEERSEAAAYQVQQEELEARYATEFAEIGHQWEEADDVVRRFTKKRREKLQTQVLRLIGRHDRSRGPKLARAEMERNRSRAHAETMEQEETSARSATQLFETKRLQTEKDALWAPLESQWNAEVLPLLHQVMAAQSRQVSSAWPATVADVDQWHLSAGFSEAIILGRLALDLSQPGALPRDPRLTLPGLAQVELPLALVFPEQGSVLFETADSGDPAVMSTLNSIILQLFASVPPGKLIVTIIDPVGLGQNFAGLMALGDYEESIINRRIWTQREQIDERLAELNEHIEKMIQMYLRDEFATISQYNQKAGTVAEKYHLLVMADFPAGLSETAAKRLQSIAVSGPRCGVFTLIHRDSRQPFPEGLVPEELRKRSVCLQGSKGRYGIDPALNPSGAALLLDAPPRPEVATALVHRIGRTSVDSNRVEVPFSQIAPRENELWQSETAGELRVPIGRTGATKLQYLAIGKGTRQHALFAGKTGSGKSTLFHVIITNLALWCSPQEVEFYLIDFKKGVEFKCYASQRLPHARVVAIESDREFALSVLQRVDEELRRRGDLFRALGVQDVAGYKRAGGTEPMPRSLLIIDEFQEFFVEDDTTAQGAALLFDRIVRQGRAFGIHVLLGSQTLGGAYTLARATLGQMAIRVALQCNEADAYLIMDENNAAPRLLSRPGEGIYNDAAGAVEGNSPFQVVWLADEERDRRLAEIRALAEARHWPVRSPVVFEGNAPAAVEENDSLREVLAHPPARPPSEARFWLGAPNAIKGPTEVRLSRQSGHHLLLVGQREEAAITLLALSLLALGRQYPPGSARFFFFVSSPAGSPELEFLQNVVLALPHEVTLLRGGEIGPALQELATELKTRSADEEGTTRAPATFLFVQGLQRFKKLKYEDDFSFSSSDEGGSPGAQLNEIISEGASLGLHLLVSVDTFANVQRWLNRKAIGEFSYRVLFQMSANDSASLIDSPQASSLGLYRALLYNEQEGSVETFRPYARPRAEWLSRSPAAAAAE